MDDKNNSTSGATEATAPSARGHHAGDGGAVAGGTKRFSAKRKLAQVPRASCRKAGSATRNVLRMRFSKRLGWEVVF